MKVKLLTVGAAGIALVVVTLLAATGAWACFPLPVLSVQPRASGPAGTLVTVEGVDFGGGVASEVRWNAIDGPLLGRGSSDRFSIPVTIPQAGDGVYAIVALVRKTDDSVGVKAVAPFQVSSSTGGDSVEPVKPVDAPRSSSSTSGLSTGATAALALLGGGLALAGGVVGAFLARRRRPAAPQPPAAAIP